MTTPAASPTEAPSGAPPGRRRVLRRIAFRLVLLVAGLLIAVLLAEVVVRLVAPQNLAANASWYQANERYRFRHRANLDENLEWGQPYHLRTNSHGLRAEQDYPLDPGDRWRIVVHGDSFTFGNGVESDETFVRQAERQLQAAGLPAEVLNFGVSAHGPSLEYIYFCDEGQRYQPAVVVVAVYLGNDATDDRRDRALVFDNGEAAAEPRVVPQPISFAKRLTDTDAYQFLIRRSHLLVLLRRTLAGTPAEPGADVIQPDEAAELVAFSIRVWRAFVRRIRAAGATPVFLLLPTRDQLDHHRGDLAEAPLLADTTRAGLTAALADDGVLVVDPTEALLAATQETDGLFIPGDFHYNATGHAAVGATLAAALSGLRATSD